MTIYSNNDIIKLTGAHELGHVIGLKDIDYVEKLHQKFLEDVPNIDITKIRAIALSEALPDYERYSENLEENHLEWISRGEVELCRESFINNFYRLAMQTGFFADNIVKHLEYTAVTQVVQVTYAAIQGGIPPKVAWSLREFFIRKIGNANKAIDYYKISYEVLMVFVEMVRELSKVCTDNLYINKAKSIILLKPQISFL